MRTVITSWEQKGTAHWFVADRSLRLNEEVVVEDHEWGKRKGVVQAIRDGVAQIEDRGEFRR